MYSVLKFVRGFEAWGNLLFITEPQDDFFCFIPQASQPSMNFNISKLVYCPKVGTFRGAASLCFKTSGVLNFGN